HRGRDVRVAGAERSDAPVFRPWTEPRGIAALCPSHPEPVRNPRENRTRFSRKRGGWAQGDGGWNTVRLGGSRQSMFLPFAVCPFGRAGVIRSVADPAIPRCDRAELLTGLSAA